MSCLKISTASQAHDPADSSHRYNTPDSPEVGKLARVGPILRIASLGDAQFLLDYTPILNDLFCLSLPPDLPLPTHRQQPTR
ncbi:unnamed protein product [Diplocarpon coronariae]